MQTELAGQILRGGIGRFRERLDQSDFDAEIDQVNRIEAAAPFENARDLGVRSDRGILLLTHAFDPSFAEPSLMNISSRSFRKRWPRSVGATRRWSRTISPACSARSKAGSTDTSGK